MAKTPVRTAPSPAPKTKGLPSGTTLASNRKASFEYEIVERFEAGIVLSGTEIKSIRAGKADIGDAYVRLEAGEGRLIGMHIAEWPGAASQNHEPKRVRVAIGTKVKAKGLTLIPLRLYLSRGRCKVEIGLGRGKKAFDKRAAIADREGRREAERQLGDWKRGE
ncbi:MAG: SsrA-binding protein [Chloroflexota bacterium]